MPRLCVLDGIVIRMNTRDHDPAHLHAWYAGRTVRVELDHLTVVPSRDRFPHAQERLLLQWAAVHRDELVRNWERARQGLPHEPIAPTLVDEGEN